MYQLKEYTRLLQSQDNVPCCTASATLTALETIFNTRGENYNFSRLFLYYNTRKLQNRIGQKGANLAFTFDALKQFGCCQEKDWPFYNHRIDKEPTPTSYRNAIKFDSINFRSLPRSEFKIHIDRNIPIIIGMNIGRKFLKLFGPLAEQLYFPINDTSNRLSRGHAMVIVGYNNNICSGSWIVANSMGLKWGDKGFGILPYECEIDIFESHVIEICGNSDLLEKVIN